MKRHSIQLLLSFLFISALACNTLMPPPATPTPSADWVGPIEGIASLQPSDIPEHLQTENPAKQGGELDANDYFTATSSGAPLR
jgi:hypothetical protein